MLSISLSHSLDYGDANTPIVVVKSTHGQKCTQTYILKYKHIRTHVLARTYIQRQICIYDMMGFYLGICYL